MKKIVTIVPMLLIGNAFAVDFKINVEARTDLIKNSMTTNLVDGTSDKDTSTSFKNNMIRLNIFSQFTDTMSLRFRQRFTNTATATSARDNSNNLTDFIYIDHKNSYFTTRLGKQSWTQAAGRETFVSGSDTFLATDAVTDFRSVIGEYRFGVSGMYKFLENQNLTIALSNPNTAVTDTTGNSKNNSLAYGAYYNGSFLEKLIQPTIGYTASPQDAESNASVANQTKKASHSIWAVGLRSEFSNVVFDLDYKTMTKANRNSGSNTSLKKEETKSIYLNAAYTINEFTPFVQYFNDKKEYEGVATSNYKKNSYVLGVTYKPNNEFNFRYHLAFSSSNKKTDAISTTATKQVKDTNIIFGIKADI